MCHELKASALDGFVYYGCKATCLEAFGFVVSYVYLNQLVHVCCFS